MNRMLSQDIAYLAGIFDGEGWIVTNRKTAVSLNIAMTDFDVIEKLYRQTGIGSLEGPFTKKTGKKPQLKWIVRKQEELTELLYAILPFLSGRRTIRVHEALVVLEEQRVERERRIVEFVCGHPKLDDNTYHTNQGKTICRQCSLSRVASRYKSEK